MTTLIVLIILFVIFIAGLRLALTSFFMSFWFGVFAFISGALIACGAGLGISFTVLNWLVSILQ